MEYVLLVQVQWLLLKTDQTNKTLSDGDEIVVKRWRGRGRSKETYK